MKPSPKLITVIIALMWGLIFTFALASIIILSIPVQVGNSLGVHDGWWYIGQNGLNKVLRGFKPNEFAIWFGKGQEISSFNGIVVVFTNVLVIVVPIVSVLFILLHIRLVQGVKHPKSIEFVDAINRRRKAYKKSKRAIRRGTKKTAKDKMKQQELDTIKVNWQQEIKSADEDYDKELVIWKEVNSHKDKIYYFWKFNRKRNGAE